METYSSTGVSPKIMRDSAKNTMATIHPAMAGQEKYPVGIGGIQHLLAGLQDFVDITPHTPVLI